MARVSRNQSRQLQIWVIPVAAILALALLYGLVSSQVAAWVGGKIISQAQLKQRMNIMQYSYELQYGDNSQYNKNFAQDFRRDILQMLTEEELLLEHAAGLATAEEQQEYANSLLSWIKTGFYQDQQDKYEQDLSAHNLTEEMVVEYFRNNLLLVRLREQQTKDIEVSESEVQEYYQANRTSFNLPEMIKVSHILVDDKAAADELLSQLKSGADFVSLAKASSKDEQSAVLGGSLPWFARGTMVEAFETAAFALEPGQLSTVIQTQHGYHIIKVEGKESAREREFNEVAESAETKALEAKRKAAWDQFVKEVRGKRLILLLAR